MAREHLPAAKIALLTGRVSLSALALLISVLSRTCPELTLLGCELILALLVLH